MSKETNPNDPREVSDGYHTFNELYEHRHMLYLALLQLMPDKAWISRLHSDGSSWDGWFLAGIDLPTGTITYHLPTSMIEIARGTGAMELDQGKEWDGHTSADVVVRLYNWLKIQQATAEPPPCPKCGRTSGMVYQQDAWVCHHNSREEVIGDENEV